MQTGTMSSLVKEFRLASRESNRSILELVVEAIRLRFSVGRLGVSEYLDFRLFLKDLSLEEKQAFAGWRCEADLQEILVDDYSRFLSLDKVSMYLLLHAYGLPIPCIKAVYRSRRPQGLRSLGSPEELAAYLREPGVLPVYMKPSMSAFGRGNALLTELRGDDVAFGDDTTLGLLEFCKSLDDGRTLGWILQEPLRPHARIAELCSNKISGVRVHTFLRTHGPEVTKAVLKINVGQVDWDNFQHGKSGNMLGALDVKTGVVTRVISGTGSHQQVNPRHPRSGRELVGFQVPFWRETVAVLSEASLAFPGFLCPGWDIAICDDGPRILEVNFFGDADLSQHAYREGFVDRQLLNMMKTRELDHLLKSPPKRSQRSSTNHRLGVRRHHWRW